MMMFDVGLAWLGLHWLSMAWLALTCLGLPASSRILSLSMSRSLATRTKTTIHSNLATLQISRAMVRVSDLGFMV